MPTRIVAESPYVPGFNQQTFHLISYSDSGFAVTFETLGGGYGGGTVFDEDGQPIIDEITDGYRGHEDVRIQQYTNAGLPINSDRTLNIPYVGEDFSRFSMFNGTSLLVWLDIDTGATKGQLVDRAGVLSGSEFQLREYEVINGN
jgi:hypothetical protein